MSNFILEGTDGWDLHIWLDGGNTYIHVRFETLAEALTFGEVRGLDMINIVFLNDAQVRYIYEV